jgi:hypothetical protein
VSLNFGFLAGIALVLVIGLLFLLYIRSEIAKVNALRVAMYNRVPILLLAVYTNVWSFWKSYVTDTTQNSRPSSCSDLVSLDPGQVLVAPSAWRPGGLDRLSHISGGHQ